MDSPVPIPIVTRVVRNGSGEMRREPAADAAASVEAPAERATPASAQDASAAPPQVPTAERIELPPERRLSAATLAGLAAAAGIAAIVLGGWAFVSGIGTENGDVAGREAAPTGFEEALALLAHPGAERLPLRGSVSRIILVVQPGDDASLVLNGLGEAPAGWAYQAWVTPPNEIVPRSAGLFSAREAVVPLAVSVREGATVSVTLEPATGSFAPTRTPKLVVERPA